MTARAPHANQRALEDASEKPKRRPPAKNRLGLRPGSKLSKTLGKEICERVAIGVPIAAAARASGVSENTVYEWIRRGLGEDDRPRTPLTEWFAGEFSRSLAECHAGLVAELREGAKTEPRLLMFMLERRFPDDWGRREIQQHTGEVEHRHEVHLAFDATPTPASVRRRLAKPVDVIDLDRALLEEKEGS